MGFSLLLQNASELWKEWDMRLLVLLSLFLQFTLATQVSRRKYKFRKWILTIIWTAYISADSIMNLALGIFSNHMAKETKGTIDPKSQITAFWTSFLLLHLGGPDTITAFVQEDNEIWLRQLLRLCIQVGLVGFIHYMALSGSTLSMLATAMILVGLMKYTERILCLYLANKGHLLDSMVSLLDGPSVILINPEIMKVAALMEEEGYQVKFIEEYEDMALEDCQVNHGQISNDEDAAVLKAYKLFKVFKLLFLGFISNISDLQASKSKFMDMTSVLAFRIVEIELGFMYDLLYTKVPLLNCAWGIIRWVISLSVICAVLLFFSLQDKKDYAKVDICITFLLISVTILLEIYSLLLAISSDWVNHWRLQSPRRSAIRSAMAFLRCCRNLTWSNSVAQSSFLRLSIWKKNRIFLKYPMLTKLDEKLMIFHIGYKELEGNIKEWIFHHMIDMVKELDPDNRLKSGLEGFKQVVSNVLNELNYDLIWSVENKEFEESILIWHIATEFCHFKDLHKGQEEDDQKFKMSKLVSRYMLYLILLHPSMLPTGIGVLRYKDTSDDIQKFLERKLAVMSKNSVSSIIIRRVKKLFKKERYVHTGVRSCEKGHASRESRDVCELCYLLLQMTTDYLDKSTVRAKSRSVLREACHLASQLNNIESKWDLISKVWAKFLIYAAYQCKGHEHCESLSRGGELLSHVWLLLAHLGVAEAVQIFKHQSIAKLIRK